MFLGSALSSHLPAGRVPSADTQAYLEATIPHHAGELANPQAAVKGSTLSRWYAHLTDMAQSSDGNTRWCGARLLLAGFDAGGATPAALEVFYGSWTAAVTACLRDGSPDGVKAAGCRMFSHLVMALACLSPESHLAREIGGQLSTLAAAIVRLALSTAPPDAAVNVPAAAMSAMTACLCWHVGLVRQAKRKQVLLERCVAMLDDHNDVARAAAQQCLAAFAIRFEDMPFCKSFCDKLINSLLLLVGLTVPTTAKLGLGLDGLRHEEQVLAMPPLTCSATSVLHRFTGLMGALKTLLVSPPALHGATVVAVPFEPLFKLLTGVASLQPIADKSTEAGNAMWGSVAAEKNTLAPLAFNSILPDLRCTTLDLLGGIVRHRSPALLRYLPPITACVAHAVKYSCEEDRSPGSYLGHPRQARAAFTALRGCLEVFGAGCGASLIQAAIPHLLSAVHVVFMPGLDVRVSARHGAALDAGAAALQCLQALLLCGGSLLPEASRTPIDTHLLLWCRHVSSGSSPLSASFRQELYAALVAGVLTPLDSGGSSHLVSFAPAILQRGVRDGATAVSAYCRLAMASVEAVIHPRALPLVMPSTSTPSLVSLPAAAAPTLAAAAGAGVAASEEKSAPVPPAPFAAVPVPAAPVAAAAWAPAPAPAPALAPPAPVATAPFPAPAPSPVPAPVPAPAPVDTGAGAAADGDDDDDDSDMEFPDIVDAPPSP